LNVRDALVYLEDVKKQFADQPDVYNRFLDIMKEFKSHAIDTPGVIDRVLELFGSNMSLIIGFNTFLPPGYEIGPDPIGVRVTTPQYTRPQGQQGQQSAMPIASGARPHAGPAEFNHAITFVNKIKNRFASQPDIYKQFLEILQQYQRENKPLKDVYAHVQVLFREAEDLLVEFKQFLPDPSANAAATTAPAGGVGAVRSNAGTQKRQKQQTSIMAGGSMSEGKTSASADELVFFERVKRHLTNKQTYVEFIKILNLFSQEILDRKQVVERVEPFLSNRADLFDWFKMFVGYDGKQEVVINEAPPREKIDLSRCKAASTSYRVLPLADQKLPCSGREDMCYEVVNDKYVSHPTWASEDQEFIAHRKNQFEEAMHRCEEERYEYDLYIEANLHTIALLEPIARRIEMMTAEERAAFRLPDGMGGQSRTIYKRIMRKVYEDRASDIIEQLQVNPTNTVPVVLARLKQKDEEWRKAQRESNKIWREVEIRNYYKSLDHQGINFKGNDKRTLSHKTLLEKVEAIYKEQMAARRPGDPRPAYQFSFDIQDNDLIQDVASLLMTCMDRQTAMSSADREHVEDFILGFLKDFFGLRKVESDRLHRMTLQRSAHNGRSGSAASDADRDDALSVVSHDSDADSSSSLPGRRTRGREQSLRRDVLLRRGAQRADGNDGDDTSPEESEAKAEDGDSSAMARNHGRSMSSPSSAAASVQDESADNEPSAAFSSTVGRTLVCFGNNAFYIFFRLYQTLYHRLQTLKKTAGMEGFGRKVNPVAEGMAIQHRLASVLLTCRSIKTVALNDYDLANDNYYRIELDLIARLLMQDMDKNTFEDSTRYLFGTKGYIMFTVNHLAQSILRQV
ncbi:Sin3 family co-repressor-domain-containing protein, partial [Thamnocephalis sphaerospora]